MLSTAAAELLTSDPDTDQAAVAVTQAARTLAPGHKNEWVRLVWSEAPTRVTTSA